MSGRMAMNTPWECAKIDREIFGETEEDTMNREELLLVSMTLMNFFKVITKTTINLISSLF